MCGIAGIYNLNVKRKTQNQKETIKKMTDMLAHRGPDDEGFFVDVKIALGHRRLAIIDPTKDGHQPMRRDNLIIVFNGEVYNYLELKEELVSIGYKFETKTDTEVILAAYQEWGKDCVHKFNGMWAFAIYNIDNGNLFCSRDRLGVKPFYYYLDKDKFIFASEIKALLAHPDIIAKPVDQAIYDYLFSGYVDHREDTMLKGVKELRGGENLIIQNTKLAKNKYWDLKNIKPIKITDKEAIKKYRDLFLDSVKLRLRSDVPIGSCLSGGLDSSAIVCAVNNELKNHKKIAQIGRWQNTYSACYDPKKFEKCDERSFIRAVIKKTGAKSHEVFPSGKKLAKELEDLIYIQELPFGSTSIYAQYNVFRKAYQQKTKVMLDGQGSDELLAGYHTFFPVYFQSLKQKHQYIRFIREFMAYSKIHHYSLWQNVQGIMAKSPIFKVINKRLKLKFKNPLSGSYFDYSLYNHKWYNRFTPFNLPKPTGDVFDDQSYLLTTAVGLTSLLRYEDRNSMAFSIESRTPFLDYRLVEFTYSLPKQLKIREGQTKWVMRQALKGILPEKIRTRQDKIGFATPEEIWLKKNLVTEMRMVFSSKSFASRGYFNTKKVQESFEKFLHGEPILYQLFWRIYNLELWLRKFVDQK